MVLKEHQLVQIDEDFIHQLKDRDPDALAGLSIKLANDLKEALERLNQSPSNSSRPSGSLAPWDTSTDHDDWDSDETAAQRLDEAMALSPDEATDPQSSPKQTPRKPGRQPGSQGFGRSQTLPIMDTQQHRCGSCPVCQSDLSAVEKAYTGFQTINLEFGTAEAPGVALTTTQHLYYQGLCSQCGLESRTEPWRAPACSSDWANVGLTQWRLVGPDLAAMIVYLSMDMRMTRRQVQRFLQDVFGLHLSLGTVQNCMIESARALAPVEQQLIDGLRQERILHADETSHKEAGTRLWLWVFISTSTALFQIGYRSKELFVNLLDSLEFTGQLMSDGYCVYRDYLQRLRCWAHLLRKAQGLCDCYSKSSRQAGKQLHGMLKHLMNAVYQAREGPDKGTVSIAADHSMLLNDLRNLCEDMAQSSHKKTRELGREFLNDWDVIFRVLENPAWPLTNNEAERALRHWVILRKISQGTRSEQGSRALALFASVIATCRLRNSSPLLYLRDVMTMRRQGDVVPALPSIPVSAIGA